MIRKPIVLFLALLLPVLIFVFLHFFGRNEFNVPIYFQSPSDEVPGDCSITYPYHVQDSNFQINGPTVVLFTGGLNEKKVKESIFQLSRLKDEFKDHAPSIVLLSQETSGDSGYENEIALDSASYVQMRKCVFLAGSNQLALIDNEKQIRGFYSEASLKEVDRLIVELKIIFNEY
ncbi:MAG: hypothetical protein RIA63_15245 [Cyclobacteriaceae bacterium]